MTDRIRFPFPTPKFLTSETIDVRIVQVSAVALNLKRFAFCYCFVRDIGNSEVDVGTENLSEKIATTFTGHMTLRSNVALLQ